MGNVDIKAISSFQRNSPLDTIQQERELQMISSPESDSIFCEENKISNYSISSETTVERDSIPYTAFSVSRNVSKNNDEKKKPPKKMNIFLKNLGNLLFERRTFLLRNLLKNYMIT